MAGNGFVAVTFQQLIDDGILAIGDGYRAKNNELGGNGPIFLRAGHVTDSHINFDGVDHFQVELGDKVRHKMAQTGDTIVTTKGNSTGRTSFVTDRMPPFVYSPHLSYWRSVDIDQIENGFLRYWSCGREFANQLSGMKASTDMAPYLSLTDQRRLKITLPPIKQQKAIASILGALDDKIELNRRMNETLESMARAIFKSWFVDFDPVRAKMDGQQPAGMNPETAALFPDSFEEQDGEMIPKGWEVKPVSSIIKVIGGGTPKKSEAAYWDGNIPWFSVRDAPSESDVFVIDTDLKITERGPKESSTKLLPEGTTIISARGTVGKLAMVASEMTMNQSCYGIFPNEESGVCFNFFVLKHVVDQLKQNAHGAVFDTITTSTFDTVEITQSNREIVRSFEAEAEPLLERIKSNVYQSQTLANLRDTLLPKLLSGELRVPEAEKQVEEVV